MMTNKYVWIVAIILVCLATLTLWRTSRTSVENEISSSVSHFDIPAFNPINQTAELSNATTPPAFAYVKEFPAHPLTRSFGTSAIPREREPEILLEIFDAYRRATGTYPVAEDNRNMMHILTGGQNELGGVFPRKHDRINQRGELVDGWGTPFYFHCISSTHIEIRSAGPDAELYTPDDIIVPDRPVSSPL